MRSDLISEMYRLEATYWWHVAKRRMVLALMQPYIQKKEGSLQFLDAGCGTGMMLHELSSFGSVIGLDGSSQAVNYCRKRNFASTKLVDLGKKIPLKNNFVDFVTMLDVLEHLDDDNTALKELCRVLKPGGVFILTVPAYPSLWTYWDEILGHKRRYRRTKLENKLNRVGFDVVRKSYFYTYLLPSAIIFRLTKTILGSGMQQKSDFIALPKFLNKFLLLLSQIETAIVKRINLPTGLSIILVCKKR